METPDDWGHPVSGVREFGYYQDTNGNYVYYTRGVDRVERPMVHNPGVFLALPSAFEGADNLWNAFQANVAGFINYMGGEAQVNADFISRADWVQLNKVLSQQAPVSSLPGFNNPCD